MLYLKAFWRALLDYKALILYVLIMALNVVICAGLSILMTMKINPLIGNFPLDFWFWSATFIMAGVLFALTVRLHKEGAEAILWNYKKVFVPEVHFPTDLGLKAALPVLLRPTTLPKIYHWEMRFLVTCLMFPFVGYPMLFLWLALVLGFRRLDRATDPFQQKLLSHMIQIRKLEATKGALNLLETDSDEKESHDDSK